MIRPATFKPRRWLRNGHLQTIAGNFLPRVDRLPAPTSELVAVPLPPEMRALPEAVALDRVMPSRVLLHCHWQPRAAEASAPGQQAASERFNQDAMTVLLVHGLEGSSHSQYVVGNANKLWAAGCNVLRMNMRNCGATDALSPSLYHSGLSTDVLAVLDWAIARGCGRVVLAGYSMGGNLVLKAAGELCAGMRPEFGAEAPRELAGVVAVSPPIDLRESADALHAMQNRMYERRFLRNLSARYLRKTRLFPAVFDRAPLEKVRSIRDFDEYVMAPHCGFAGADDYYARAGASRVVSRITVPTLVLHACDDPFIRLTAATREQLAANPHITLLEPEHGGHCAFLEEPRDGYDGYWAEARLLEVVSELAKAPRPFAGACGQSVSQTTTAAAPEVTAC